MSTSPSSTATGHTMAAKELLTARMRYTVGVSFNNEHESCICLTIRFADNMQADVHINLSNKVKYSEFSKMHKNMPKPFEGLMAIGARDDRLVIEWVHLCGYWHKVIS